MAGTPDRTCRRRPADGGRDHSGGLGGGRAGAERDRHPAFDRFYRTAAARAVPGSCLGLSIVRQVAEGHGGTVGPSLCLPNQPAPTDLPGPAAGR